MALGFEVGGGCGFEVATSPRPGADGQGAADGGASAGAVAEEAAASAAAGRQ